MKIEYEKLVSFLIKLVIVLTYFISFDKYINVAHIIIAFIFILMLISLKTKENKISFYKSDWLYVGFAIYCIIDSILFSSVDGIKYSIYLLSAIVLSFCIRNHNDNDVKIFSIIQIMSTIFSAVTILFYFLPSLKISSYYMIYSYDKASEISRLSGIAGLAGQTGLNSFYIGLGIITLFVYIINNQGKNQKRKILAFFLLFLNCIAFMLTQKRGPLLFLVFSIIYIYILMKIRIISI